MTLTKIAFIEIQSCMHKFNLEWIDFYASLFRILMTDMYNIGIYLVTCTSPLLLKIHGTNILAKLED